MWCEKWEETMGFMTTVKVHTTINKERKKERSTWTAKSARDMLCDGVADAGSGAVDKSTARRAVRSRSVQASL